MIALNERQVRRLNIGDEVIYHERTGSLTPYFYRARVTGKYPHLITLSVAAHSDKREPYENARAYFNTCYCYDDGVEFGGYKLYKETENDI